MIDKVKSAAAKQRPETNRDELVRAHFEAYRDLM